MRALAANESRAAKGLARGVLKWKESTPELIQFSSSPPGVARASSSSGAGSKIPACGDKHSIKHGNSTDTTLMGL